MRLTTSRLCLFVSLGAKCNIELLEETSPPGYGPENKPQDDHSVGTQDSKEKIDKKSAETKSTITNKEKTLGKPSLKNRPKEFINPLLFVEKSSYRVDRWYKMHLK